MAYVSSPEAIRKGVSIYVELEGLVCVDVDHAYVWDRLIQDDSREFLGNPIFTRKEVAAATR